MNVDATRISIFSTTLPRPQKRPGAARPAHASLPSSAPPHPRQSQHLQYSRVWTHVPRRRIWEIASSMQDFWTGRYDTAPIFFRD